MKTGRIQDPLAPTSNEDGLVQPGSGQNDEGVDLTLIASFLRLTPTDRIRMAESHAAAVYRLQAAFA